MEEIPVCLLVFAGISLIALLVATIGIANTMYMAILEREKTIAMMKVLGGRPADILKSGYFPARKAMRTSITSV